MISNGFLVGDRPSTQSLKLHGLENLWIRRKGDDLMGLKGGIVVGAIGGLVGEVVNLIVELYWIRRYPEHIEYVPLTVNTVGGMIVVAIIAGILFGASYAKL